MDEIVQRQVDEQVRLFEAVWLRNLERRLNPTAANHPHRRHRLATVAGKLRSLFL